MDQYVIDSIDRAGDILKTLWKGKFSEPAFADELAHICSSAIDAIRPYVIRHGVAMLSPVEQSLFGATAIIPLNSQEATDEQKEILSVLTEYLRLARRPGRGP